MNQPSKHSVGLLCALLVPAQLLLNGCASDISPDSYADSHVGEASSTYQGTIVSVRPVKVTGGDQLSDNFLGAALGAAAGGLAGSTMGGGKGNLAMTGLGAVAGGTAGAFAEKKLKEQKGLEYVVQLTNGSMMTVVQGPKDVYAIGQKVFVIVGRKGRSRIVPNVN